MDDRPFYYRLRGQTKGPFDLRQIRQLAQRSAVSRSTDVSRDGLQWAKAAEFPEIFSTSGSAVTPPGGRGGIVVERVSYEPTDASPGPGGWYYTVDGQTRGPVDAATLRQFLAAGTVPATTQVVPVGSQDWVPVSSVPELSGAGPIVVTGPSGTPTSQSKSNGLAIAGFVLSLVGIPICCVCGLIPIVNMATPFIACLAEVVGLILSAMALNGRNRANRGLAIAGVVISLVSLTLVVILFVLAIVGVLVVNLDRPIPEANW